MNTPAHAIVNLVILKGRLNLKWAFPAVVVGAIAPDLFIFLYYFFEKVVKHTTETVIWGPRYFESPWHYWIEASHSFPILAFFAVVTYFVWKKKLVSLFFQSMFLHSIFDFPIHHSDAHAHFFPFSNWRFQSPISYWNPLHYGQYFMAFESVLVIGFSIYLWRTRKKLSDRLWVMGIAAVYFLGGVYAWVIWGLG